MHPMAGVELEREIAAAETELAELTRRRAAVAERLAAMCDRQGAGQSPPADDPVTSSAWAPAHKLELSR
jgi:hypothetical protein